MSAQKTPAVDLDGIAIIGMSGRFPGASSVAEFWQNQLKGVESISQFRVEELEVSNAAELVKLSNYVRARGVLKDVDKFDPEFFSMLPREAELTDPQHRLFLECCWETFESAGYNPFTYPGSVGVFAGASLSTYFLSQLCAAPNFIQKFTGEYQIGNYSQMIGNSLDFLATRIAYKFNLRGPAFTMQAGCSTSLLAVCQACQTLLTYQADMALAGGSSITLPQKRGYLYQDGGMGSADGHTRTFDADAQGTVFGSGVAVVLLKRLEDAVRDGDCIHAVIRGFAMNNDGSAKVAYTAPSVEGQSRVIAMAQEASGIDPATIGYVEAHGTGTPLGDPIELAALTKAFRSKTQAKQFCAVGTVKPNVGHLDVAAGVTGLIHATHVVRHGKLTPTLHFQKPNPNFDLTSSPFYVNTKLQDWKLNSAPRRAGVSAFGVGGTNAHVILEEAPLQESGGNARARQLLVLSARSSTALDAVTANLQAFLRDNPSVNLADVAFTLQVGRSSFHHRRAAVVADSQEALSVLRSRDPKRLLTRSVRQASYGTAYLFPGQGSQQPNMGRELYESEAVFREEIDRCAQLLMPDLGMDLREALYPQGNATSEVQDKITQTLLAQPAIFTVEYALARLWMSWGIEPRFMLGHSVGEFAAACIAGVFSLPDALRLIAARGRLMQSLPSGAMLSVRLSEDEVRVDLPKDLSVAAINGPSLTVVSGPFDAIEKLEAALTRKDVIHRRLHTSHAFHSAMMDPILEPFLAEVRKVRLNPPRLPYLSGVTGDWIREEEATSPQYWARHFREPVRFLQAVAKLQEKQDCILLEVGPGNVLATLAKTQSAKSSDQTIVSSLHDGSATPSEAISLQQALGRLWISGLEPNWHQFHKGERRLRVPLPTYPFERRSFWAEALPTASTIPSHPESQTPAPDVVPLTEPDMLTTMSANPSSNHPVESSMTQQSQPTRQPRSQTLRRLLAEIFKDLSGIDVAAADSAASFLDMGFDSLFLTQVTQALQSKFNLKVTFRQLLGDQGSLDALTQYLDQKLPAGAFEESPSVEVPAPVQASAAQLPADQLAAKLAFAQPVVPSAPVSGSPVEQLIRAQLQAMNQLFAQQLAVLSGANANFAPPAAPAKPPASVSSIAPVPSPTPPAEAKTGELKELKGYTPFKPMQKDVSGELSARQQSYIHDLVARYEKRTRLSKAKTQEYRKVHADPRVVSGFRSQWKEMVYPIITDRSQGSHLWDIDGNEYVDILNGFGPIMLGHRPEYVEKAVEKQLREGFEIGPQTLLAGEVAKMLCEMTGNERATFCNTGSEAVIAAMRVARTVTGRDKVVIFAGDYHGMFDEVLVKGIKKDGQPVSIPSAPGIPREKAANIVVLEYGAQESLEWIRQNAGSLAAVIVEPVQSRHPNLQPVEFLKELRKITEASDTCFVFDEVVTGFRVHPGGCQALFGIRADLATYGKVLAGGMPIGVLAGKSKYMDALDGGMWQYGDDSYPEVGVTFMAGTFVRHPLAMAACKAVLLHLKESAGALQERLSARTVGLVKCLNELLQRNHVPTHIENFASIFFFSFPSEFRFGSLFYYSLREKGIYLLEGFPCFLTTEHTDADLEKIVRAFEETIAEMQAGGIFPLPSGEALAPEKTAATASSMIPVTEVSLTESQLEILLAAELAPEANCSFNESFSLHLKGNLNESIFTKCLNTLVAQHDALRAKFPAHTQKQVFVAPAAFKIPVHDLTSLADPDRQARFDEWVAKDSSSPFDLANGPMFRAALFRFAPDRHVFVCTSHHIVCDGWSTNVLLDELSRLYNAELSGSSVDLGLHMNFSEYAHEQEKHFQGQEGAENESYWTEQFQTLPPLLNLPLDRPRSALKSYSGATLRKKIGAEAYRAIKKAGAQQKCTLFVTLLSGFHALLNRLSGQSDIVVGIPAAGQSLIEDRTLVGHCVNFVPLRGDLSNDPSMSEFLLQMRKRLLDAYDHQNYTYGRLVRKLSIPRDPSRLPLIEVQFNLEKVGTGLHFKDLQVDVDPNPKSFVNFDLFLNVVESDEGLTLDLDYNTDLMDHSTVSRWMDCYETFLLGFAENSSQSVSRLPILSQNDRNYLVKDVNRTDSDYPRAECVQNLFERQAVRVPDKVAIEFEERTLTYRQLNEKANQLAHYLIQLGVQPGDLVGIYMERSTEMIVALLATWKAGAAYVPLDPTFPRERLAFVFEDTSVPLLLTQSRLLQDLPATDAKTVCLDRDGEAIEREKTVNPERLSDPSQAAYTIYTSGSTGKPKGVTVIHRNVVNLLNSMAKRPGLCEDDVLLAVTTISFDIAGLEIYLPLIKGAKLVFTSRMTASDGRQLLKVLSSSAATVMQATPITFRLLLEAGWQGTPKFKVLCGGEALQRELANRILACNVPLWNMYGPTETTIWSATSEVTTGDGPVTVGPPIDNTQFYVLDTHREPVPLGVPGELYIGGDGVASGYYKRPELTAERFLPDPFRPQNGALLYRTGDLVRRLASGDFEFLGRMDGQIKLRGFRIELGEIENALTQHPGIKQALVIVREDVPGDKRLVAYLLPNIGGIPAAGHLRTFLLAKLPDYMIPTAFITLPSFPLTPNGKVDKNALPSPTWGGQSRGSTYVEPRNPVEKQMADIWAEVLRMDKVGVEDNLFELGADSLHVFQIVARANKAGIDVKPRQILQFRTISGILAELGKANTVSSQVPVLAPVSRSKYRLVR